MKLWKLILVGFIAAVVGMFVTVGYYVGIAWIIIKMVKGM